MGKIRWLGFRGGVFVGGWQYVFLYTIISLSTFSHSLKGVGNKKAAYMSRFFIERNENYFTTVTVKGYWNPVWSVNVKVTVVD